MPRESYQQLIKKTFGDKQTLVEHISEQPFGSLLRMQEEGSGKQFFVRIVESLVDSSFSSWEEVEEFLTQFNEIRHPKIAKVYTSGLVLDRAPYVLIENFTSESLYSVVKRKSTLSFEQVIDITLSLVSSFKYLHQQKMVHGSLCPSSVFVSEKKKVYQLDKIAGFELLPFLSEASDEAIAMVDKAKCILPPEWINCEALDARSDIYSIGSVTSFMIFKKIVVDKDSIESLSASTSDMPIGLKDVLLKCLEPSAAKRYQTLEQLEEELLAIKKSYKSLPSWINNNMSTVFGLLVLLSVAFVYLSFDITSTYYQQDSSKIGAKILSLKKQTVLYKSENATTLREAIREAVSKKINLENANLDKVNLSDMDLSGVDLRGAYISGQLINTNLSNANLSGATIEKAVAPYSNFDRANLSNASIVGSTFARSTFTNVDLSNSNIVLANFFEARTEGSDFTKCTSNESRQSQSFNIRLNYR